MEEKMASKNNTQSLTVNSVPLMVAQQRVNELFDNFLDDWDILPFASDSSSFPSFNVFDQEKEIIVKAELPDIDEQNIRVEISGNTLTVHGVESKETESQEDGEYLQEVSFESFSRAVTMPFEIKEDKIKAIFSEGVLVITLQKPGEKVHQSKMISILH